MSVRELLKCVSCESVWVCERICECVRKNGVSVYVNVCECVLENMCVTAREYL